MDDGMNNFAHRGGERGGGSRGAAQINPADRAQLAESPVSIRRVLSLFGPHRAALAIVTAIIVATSIISMAQPFLVRAIIDDALPQQDVRLLALLAGGMVAVAATTSLLGVVQTWMSRAARADRAVHHRRQERGRPSLHRQASRAVQGRVMTGTTSPSGAAEKVWPTVAVLGAGAMGSLLCLSA